MQRAMLAFFDIGELLAQRFVWLYMRKIERMRERVYIEACPAYNKRSFAS